MSEDKVRVLRIVEYTGPRSWVEQTVAKSIHGERVVTRLEKGAGTIRAATIGLYPEVLEQAQEQVQEDKP